MMGFKLVAIASFMLLVGCSNNGVITDHGEDYQTAVASGTKLTLPEGSPTPTDRLHIPNEDMIANYDSAEEFSIPRAPAIYHPLAKVAVAWEEGRLKLITPANIDVTRNATVNFLTALHGDGTPIRSNAQNRIETVAFLTTKQSKLASIWSSITRLYPEKLVFELVFEEESDVTNIFIRYRTEKQGEEASEWLSPATDANAQNVAVRLWGTLGRQLNAASAYLSNQQARSNTQIWVDHRGQYVLNIADDYGDRSIAEWLTTANLYMVSDAPLQLSMKSPESLPKVGDIIDFTIPMANQEKEMKLFNVRRRNLNDIEWDERIYPFAIEQNELGKFLVIDLSDSDYPELRSFQLMSRFINN